MNINAADVTLIASKLKNNSSFNELNFSSNNINSEGLVHFAEILRGKNSVVSLDFTDNAISDSGVTAFSRRLLNSRHNITTLDFSSNNISGYGAAQLIDSGVEEILLAKNPIGNEGAKKIAEAIKRSKSLKTLDLSHTGIGEEGAKEIAEAIKINGKIDFVEMTEEAGISKETHQDIERALANNKQKSRYSGKYSDIKPMQSYTLSSLSRSSAGIGLS